MKVDAQDLFRMRFERHRADRLARLRPTQVHDMASTPLLAEIVIEGYDAMHFGNRPIQFSGDERHAVFGHETERLLHSM